MFLPYNNKKNEYKNRLESNNYDSDNDSNPYQSDNDGDAESSTNDRLLHDSTARHSAKLGPPAPDVVHSALNVQVGNKQQQPPPKSTTAATAEDGDDDDEIDGDGDDDNEIYFCVLIKGGQLACAYYDTNKKSIFFLNDAQENAKYELATLLIDELAPRSIITSSKSERNFLNYLSHKVKEMKEDSKNRKKSSTANPGDELDEDIEKLNEKSDSFYYGALHSDSSDNSDDDEKKKRKAKNDDNDDEDVEEANNDDGDDRKRRSNVSLFVLPNNEFNYELSKERIIKLNQIEGMPAEMTGSERFIFFNSLLNFENRLMISCIGGLLNLLDRYSINATDVDGSTGIEAVTTNQKNMNASAAAVVDDGNDDDSFGAVSVSADQIQTPVYQFKQIKLNKLLLMDANSFKSLQIFNIVDYKYEFRQTFKSDINRSSWRNSSSSRSNTRNESLSLYSYFLSRVSTKAGASKLRSWMMRPTRDLEVLNERHRMIEFIISNRNNDVINAVTVVLKKCKFINPILKRMRISRISMNDWKRVLNTTQALLKLFNLIKIIKSQCGLLNYEAGEYEDDGDLEQVMSKDYSQFLRDQRMDSVRMDSETEKDREEIAKFFFSKLSSIKFGTKFEYLQNLFYQIVDIAESKLKKKLKMNANVSAQLDEKMIVWRQMTDDLTKAAQDQMEKLQVSECQALYLPHYGFLLSIQADALKKATIAASSASLNSTQVSNIAEESALFERMRRKFENENELKFIFKSNNDYYYKNICMLEFDRKYGNLIWEINDIEAKIVDNLQTEFIRHSHYFSIAIDYCAEFDCLMAYASIAIENDYVKPSFDLAGSFISARRTRHPLIELSTTADCECFVPNDVLIGGTGIDQASEKIKVITGANASGKTVYLKQIGLLVYMAMIGSYVPASECILGDFDRIFTRINSNESISLRMSTFSIDVQQAADAINGATHKSLILIDEFGKGTQPEDGQALLAAMIRHWLNSQSDRMPHVYIATHFYEMFQEEMAKLLFKENRTKIEYLTFEFIQEQKQQQQQQQAVTTTCSAADKLYFMYKLKRGVAESSFAINIAKNVGLPDEIVNRAVELLDSIKKMSSNNNEKNIIGHSMDDLKSKLTETDLAREGFEKCCDVLTEFLRISIECDQLEKNAANVSNEEQLLQLKAAKFRAFLQNL